MGCATSTKPHKSQNQELQEVIDRITAKEKRLDELIRHHEDIVSRQDNYSSVGAAQNVLSQTNTKMTEGGNAMAKYEIGNEQEVSRKHKEEKEKEEEEEEEKEEEEEEEEQQQQISEHYTVNKVSTNEQPKGKLNIHSQNPLTSDLQTNLQASQNCQSVSNRKNQALNSAQAKGNNKGINHHITEEQEREDEENNSRSSPQIKKPVQTDSDAETDWRKLMDALDVTNIQKESQNYPQNNQLDSPSGLRIDQIEVLQLSPFLQRPSQKESRQIPPSRQGKGQKQEVKAVAVANEQSAIEQNSYLSRHQKKTSQRESSVKKPPEKKTPTVAISLLKAQQLPLKKKQQLSAQANSANQPTQYKPHPPPVQKAKQSVIKQLDIAEQSILSITQPITELEVENILKRPQTTMPTTTTTMSVASSVPQVDNNILLRPQTSVSHQAEKIENILSTNPMINAMHEKISKIILKVHN